MTRLLLLLPLLALLAFVPSARAQETDWRLPPTGVHVQTQMGFYSPGISPQHDYEFVTQASAPLKLLVQYPELWDWAIVMGYYGVEFIENPGCPGSMCAYYHHIGDSAYVFIGIHPDARFDAKMGLLMYIHELDHIVQMAHGNYDPRALETHAWLTMFEAARILEKAP